jgi:hypothetical protein
MYAMVSSSSDFPSITEVPGYIGVSAVEAVCAPLPIRTKHILAPAFIHLIALSGPAIDLELLEDEGPVTWFVPRVGQNGPPLKDIYITLPYTIYLIQTQILDERTR